MAKKFYNLSDGNLHVAEGDGPMRVLRRNYCWHHREIESIRDLAACLRAGPGAWPGGYPVYFIATDDEILSYEAVRENYKLVIRAYKHGGDPQWSVHTMDVFYGDDDEDNPMCCAHTGKPI